MSNKSHWEKIYQERSPKKVSWYQGTPELSLGLIQNSDISTGEAIIDVGGGASRLVDYLLALGYRDITVLDISNNALARAQQRLGMNASNVHWYSIDISQFEPKRRFSIWHDRAVFHFLVKEVERQAYVRVLKQALRLGGHLIIAAFAIGGPEKCSGLEIVQYDSEKLSRVLGEGFKLIEEKEELHETPAGDTQKFNYFRLEKIA